ncbi:hypothetical protein Taro_006258 [Colocasia esculenta]|uniref:Helicase C-terminal domain-containing protein n=1 Tax=Colocasia esculenta TaxID=4460 RepID=A0A843TVI9_COLES|nr:hypothetical protein [Colocasia esculenta]
MSSCQRQLTECLTFVTAHDCRDCYLVYVLTQMPGSTVMVFTRTCESTRLLALMLRKLGMKAIPISSHLSQAKRLGALNKFKAGECNILVCTGLMSRGLDIPQVDLVINYDIPENSKAYKKAQKSAQPAYAMPSIT